MKGVVTVFGSGAMIGVGSRSVEDAKRDLTIAYKMILKHAEHLHRSQQIACKYRHLSMDLFLHLTLANLRLG